jgi:hypothetical protein
VRSREESVADLGFLKKLLSLTLIDSLDGYILGTLFGSGHLLKSGGGILGRDAPLTLCWRLACFRLLHRRGDWLFSRRFLSLFLCGVVFLRLPLPPLRRFLHEVLLKRDIELVLLFDLIGSRQGALSEVRDRQR